MQAIVGDENGAPGEVLTLREFGNGAFADDITVCEGSLGRKPANATFEQTEAVPMAKRRDDSASNQQSAVA
jgi:hypothetical protein